MFVDSHCHLNMLNLEKYQGDLGTLIEQTKSNGIEHILCVGVDLTHAQEVINIAEQFSGVSASVGIHPSEKLTKEPLIADIENFARHPKVVAIGETGLDYHYNDSGLDTMRERFRSHIRLAKMLKKPLIIHTRDAREDTIKIMREEKANEIGGVMHCFTENWEMAEAALALNFYISFSGIVTFKNANNVADVARKVPLDKLLIETDAPYLTPVPFRGKPNEPQFVRFVAEKISELKNVSIDQVAEITTNNFYQLFSIYEAI